MRGLFQQPTIMTELIEQLSPIEYVVLRKAVPVFLRNPKTYPSSFTFMLQRLNQHLRALILHDVADTITSELTHNRFLTLVGNKSLLSILNGDEDLMNSREELEFYVSPDIYYERLGSDNLKDIAERFPQLSVMLHSLDNFGDDIIDIGFYDDGFSILQDRYSFYFKFKDVWNKLCPLKITKHAIGNGKLSIGCQREVLQREFIFDTSEYVKTLPKCEHNISTDTCKNIISFYFYHIIDEIRDYIRFGYLVNIYHDPGLMYDAFQVDIAAHMYCVHSDVMSYKARAQYANDKKYETKMMLSTLWNNLLATCLIPTEAAGMYRLKKM